MGWAMATRRSSIEVQVLGLPELRAMTSAMTAHEKRVLSLMATYQMFNAATGQAGQGVQRLGTQILTVNNTINNVNRSVTTTTNNIQNLGNSANRAAGQFGGMLTTMLQYRAVALVFSEVRQSVSAAFEAMKEMEKQAARVQRVSAPGSTPGIRATIALETARTGATIGDVGEGAYQINSQIKDQTAAYTALNTVMNLHIGLESDVRDSARSLLQVYNQFGAELGRNVDESEKLRRAGELLAIMWKGSDAELDSITNSLKYLGPVAQAAHVPIEQVAAAISALTHEGVRGRMAGTEVAQLLGQIVKNFDTSTGEIKNKGATLKAALTPEGGIDLIGTLRNFNEVASQMPVETAMKFSQAISGTMNAWRLFGSVNPEFLRVLQEKLDDATRATHGMTSEAEALRKQMGTTAQEGQRAFNGLFSTIANLVDVSPIRGWLHGIADEIEHMLVAMRMVQQFQEGQQNWSARTLAQGAPVRPAVEFTQATVRQALAAARANPHQDPNVSDFEAATIGMDQAQKNMIRHRYQRGGGNVQMTLDTEAMANDLGIMLRQLADPKFGIAPTSTGSAPSPSPSSLGLRGLTRQQAENAAIISAAAKKYGVDPLAMIAVAHYESGLSATNKNSTSTATGLFQILKGTAPGIDRSNPYQNAEFAAREIERAGGRGLTGVDAIRKIVLGFEKPDPPGRGHVESNKEIAGAIKFYSKHVDGAKGSFVDEKAAEEAQRAADEAAKKQAEILDQRAKTAQIEYEHLKKRFGDDDARTAIAARTADALAGQAGDSFERLRLRYGLTGNVVGNRAGAIGEREQRAKDVQDAADKAREEAQKRREVYAAGGPDAGIVQTSLFPFPKEMVDAFQGRPQYVAAVNAAKYAREEAEARREAWATGQNEDVGRLVAAGDAGIRARERTLRPNLVGADARQQTILEGTVADVQSTIKMLTETFKVQTPETASQLKNLQERLADANAALLDFHDTLDQKAYAKRVQSEQDAYQLRDEQIAHLHKIKFYKDQEGAERDSVQKLRELVGSAELNLATVKGRPLSANTEEETRRAAKEVDSARQNLTDYQIESKIQKYQNVYGSVKETVHGALSDFLHGRGDVGTVAQRVGGGIVDAALDASIKQFADPLINTVTQQILTIQGNTEALLAVERTLNMAVGGGGLGSSNLASTGMGAAVAAGVQSGLKDYGWGDGWDNSGPVSTAGGSGSKAASKSPRGLSDLQKGIGAGLAAYSIGATSAQQGVNAGNFLGGVTSGATIGATLGKDGGWIGGIVGGVIDLIGGLFHHADKPKETPQNLNPAYYNAPAGFDVAAYNYSAFGKLPRVQDVGFEVKPANTPIVNVYVDGAKVEAQKVITQQSVLASISLSNAYIDRAVPV